MLTLWVGALESLVNFCMLFPDMAIDINSIPATTQNVSLPLPSSVQSGLEGRGYVKAEARSNEPPVTGMTRCFTTGLPFSARWSELPTTNKAYILVNALPIALGWRAQNSAQAQGRDEP